MKKKIEDYLYLYPFTDIIITSETGAYYYNEDSEESRMYKYGEMVKHPSPLMVLFGLDKSLFKPILRHLESMTEEESSEWIKLNREAPKSKEDNDWFVQRQDAKKTKWLLSKGFDLFGLIEAGLAIDKTKIDQLLHNLK